MRQYEVDFEANIKVDADEADEVGLEQAVQNAIGHTGAQIVWADSNGEVRGG